MRIVRYAPLISIDLLIHNEKNEVLLGWRNNQPAKDNWFVPGGRIFKNEPVQDAFSRIITAETGLTMQMKQAEFHGIYEHFHPEENFMDEAGFGTHYIVFAFTIKTGRELTSLPLQQHSDYKWQSIPELLKDQMVHQYTKNYFNGTRLIG